MTEKPKITSAVLDQWEASAEVDLAAERQWSVHPAAILAVIEELRYCRRAHGLESAAPARRLMAEQPRQPEPPSFTCPKCGAKSYNPNDIREGYCGRCHDWTDARDQPAVVCATLLQGALVAATEKFARMAFTPPTSVEIPRNEQGDPFPHFVLALASGARLRVLVEVE